MTPEALDPSAPLFFVSYAHSSRWEELVQFFDDLSRDVSELTGRSTGPLSGFYDRTMPGGRLWTPDILTAVNTCQVFIPLISPGLVKSEWCGKEWHAFAEREKVALRPHQNDNQTAILPIKWVSPFQITTAPEVIKQVQLFKPAEPEIAQKYLDNGVLGLLNIGAKQAYRTVVWRLAQQVVEVSWSFHIKPSRTDVSELRNVFEEI